MEVKNEGVKPPSILDMTPAVSGAVSNSASSIFYVSLGEHEYEYEKAVDAEKCPKQNKFHEQATCTSEGRLEGEADSTPLPITCMNEPLNTKSVDREDLRERLVSIVSLHEKGRRKVNSSKSIDPSLLKALKPSFIKIKAQQTRIYNEYHQLVEKKSEATLPASDVRLQQLDKLNCTNNSKEYINQQKRILFVGLTSCLKDFDALIDGWNDDNVGSAYNCWGFRAVDDFLCENAEIGMQIAEKVSDCIICLSVLKTYSQFNELEEQEQIKKIQCIEAMYTEKTILESLSFYKDICGKQMKLLRQFNSFVNASSEDSGVKLDCEMFYCEFRLMYYRCICKEYICARTDIYRKKIIEIFDDEFTRDGLAELVDVASVALSHKPNFLSPSYAFSVILNVCFMSKKNDPIFFLLSHSAAQPMLMQETQAPYLDLARAIGWFKGIVLVIQQVYKPEDLHERLKKSLKEKLMILNKGVDTGIFRKIKNAVLQDEKKQGLLTQLEKAQEALKKMVSPLEAENKAIQEKEKLAQQEREKLAQQEKEKLSQQLIQAEALQKKMEESSALEKAKLKICYSPKQQVSTHQDPKEEQIKQPNIESSKQLLLEKEIRDLFVRLEPKSKSLEKSLAELEKLGEKNYGIKEQQQLIIIELAKIDMIFAHVQDCLLGVNKHFESIRRYRKNAELKGFRGTFGFKDEFVAAIRELPSLSEQLSELLKKLNQAIRVTKKTSDTSQNKNEKVAESIEFMVQSFKKSLLSLDAIEATKVSSDIAVIGEWRRLHLNKVYQERQKQPNREITSQQKRRSSKKKYNEFQERDGVLTLDEIKNVSSTAENLIQTVEKFHDTLIDYI